MRQGSSQVPMQGRRLAAQRGVRRGPAPIDLSHHVLLAVGCWGGHFAALGNCRQHAAQRAKMQLRLQPKVGALERNCRHSQREELQSC